MKDGEEDGGCDGEIERRGIGVAGTGVFFGELGEIVEVL